MKQLLVFDLDGTLIDSIADITSALNCALAAYSAPRITARQCLGMIGHGPEVLVRLAAPNCGEDIRENILRLYQDRYLRHSVEQTVLFPGVEEALSALYAGGVKLAVLSNKSLPHTQKTVRALFHESLFWRVLGTGGAFEAKPNPASLLHLVSCANLELKDTAYIGDSPVDIQTAANAGIDGVSVGWGYSDRQSLLDAGAGLIADNPRQMLELLQRL